MSAWGFPWTAFERLIRPPTLVSDKFIPKLRHQILRWYTLVQWRIAVFQGECDRLKEYPVKYLVTVNPSTLNVVKRCGRIVWASDSRGVGRCSLDSRTHVMSEVSELECPETVRWLGRQWEAEWLPGSAAARWDLSNWLRRHRPAWIPNWYESAIDCPRGARGTRRIRSIPIPLWGIPWPPAAPARACFSLHQNRGM